MDHKEMLRGMLQDVINDKMDQASATMHDYFVAKTKEISGLGQPAAVEADTTVTGDETNGGEATATEQIEKTE